MVGKTRYVIVDKENGVFLGTYSLADVQGKIEELFLNVGERIADKDLDRSFALFAKDNPFGVPRACSFKTKVEAGMFIYENFKKGEFQFSIEGVKCVTPYPDVVELIKSGLGDSTFDMMDCLETISETVH